MHHVGYVVENIASVMEDFVHSLNARWDHRIFEDPLQKVKVAFLTTQPGQPQIELVEPLPGDSPVRKFLAEKGGGLHHICYEVGDIAEELQAMRSRRAMVVRRPVPAVAFDGRRIAWVLTREKLLVELLEREPA